MGVIVSNCIFYLKREKGITLVEAMIVIAIVGILLGLAVPSFAGMINNHRARVWTAQMQSDLAYARQEAYRLNMNVSLCISDNGTTCTGEDRRNDWERGWIVFSQRDLSEQVRVDASTGEGVLRVRQGLPNANQFGMTGSQRFGDIVTYAPNGHFLGKTARSGFALPTQSAERAQLLVCAGKGKQASYRQLGITAAGATRLVPLRGGEPPSVDCSRFWLER